MQNSISKSVGGKIIMKKITKLFNAVAIPAIVIMFSLGLVILIRVAIQSSTEIKFKRASDGTPCYTFGTEFECNYNRSNKDTNFGEFPYASEDEVK